MKLDSHASAAFALSQSPPDAKGQARNRRVDLLRGVSIIAVLLLHFTLAFGIRNSPLAAILGLNAARALLFNGNYGVTIFFVISGYLITSMSIKRWGALSKIEPLAFYTYRLARIIPSLVLVLVVIVSLGCLGVPYFGNTDDGHHLPASFFFIAVASILTFWHNVLMQSQGWFNYCLNVYWSLSVEEVFYLILPVSSMLARRTWLIVVMCLALIVIAPMYRASHLDNGLYWECGYAACFDAVAMGCLTALLARRWLPLGVTARTLRLLAAVGMVATYLTGIDGHEIFGFTVIALCASIYLLCSARQAPASALSLRCTWPVEWLGRHSYELYLFHIVVLALMRSVFKRGELGAAAWTLWLALFITLSTFVAHLVARYISAPANLAIRNRLAARQGRKHQLLSAPSSSL